MTEVAIGSRGGQASITAGVGRGCDVAVVGAGPYGLAAAARLRSLAGVGVRVFGEPMSFWAGMPSGMLLRSAWDACHIGFASGELTLDGFLAQSGRRCDRPVPLDVFIDYGRWFADQVAPEVDPRRVLHVERVGDAFRMLLADGETVRARRVVIAAGIESFAARPAVFDGFPRELVTHSSEHTDLGVFAGRRVLVVGGGQSALESAALIHEAGGEVEVIARTEQLVWLHGGTVQRRLGRFKPLLYAQTDVGPAGLSRLVALPALFGRLPRPLQNRLAYRTIRPAGARWLRNRLTEVPIDITKYDFLAPQLITNLRTTGGYPILGAGLESNIPGLHFLGAPATHSYGPTMRFVSGSWYASTQLANHLHKHTRGR
jgi:hypothetical protein